MDRKLIDQYEAGGGALLRSIDGLTESDLLKVPPPDANVGKWSIQQIVIHLMDADLIWTSRMKCIIAEDHPQILGYDETKFAANLLYDRQDAKMAIQIFDLNRRQFARVLRKLPESAFTRTGHHNERGDISLADSVQAIVQHLDGHLKFIHKKRELFGKPIKK